MTLLPSLSAAAGSGTIPISVAESHAVEHLYLQPGGPHVRYDLSLDVDARDIAGRGNHIFIAAGDDGLVVLTGQGREIPRQTARLALPGPVTMIRLHGDIAWLTGPAGMISVDITRPDHPRVISHYPTPSAPRDLALGEDRAWLLLGREILTFDLSLPGTPIMIGRSGLRFDAHALAVRHGRAWLAAGDGGLITFDVRRPPPHAAGMIAGGTITDVALADDRVHVAGGRSGITIVEGAGVDGMRWLGSFRSEAALDRLLVDKGRALATSDQRHLYLLDVDNPEAIRIPALLSRDCCDAWHLDGDSALTLNGSRLTAWDLAAKPPQISNEGLAFGQGVNLGGQRRVYIDRDIAHVADWFAGLHLYDLKDPTRPRLLASLPTEGSAKGVIVRDGIAWVADDDHGLLVVDVRDPTRPQALAQLALPGLAYTPVLDGDRLWLAVHDRGIVAIDIADPRAPTLLAHFDTPGKAWSLRVRDGIAWVADDDAGLLILDVSDVDNIRIIGTYDPGGRAEEVLVDGDIAYVAYFDAGIYILDISNPAEPRRLGNITTPGNPRGLDLQGDRLHVADWRAGVQIIDVADPQRPQLLGRHDTDGAAWGVRVHRDHAFVADWWGGISMLDLSDPKRPAGVGSYPPRAPVRAIATTGSYAFLAQDTAGLQVFDIDNALNPTWVTGVELDGARDVAIIDQQAFVLGRAGIAVIDIADPFRARRSKRLWIDPGIRALRVAEDRLLLVGDSGVSLLDPVDAGVRRLVSDEPVSDAWYSEGHVFVASTTGLRMFDADGNPAAELTVDDGATVTHVRASADLIVIHVAGEGLRVLDRHTDEWRELARIALTDVVRDLGLDGDRLHVVTARPGVLTLDLADPAAWRVVGWHETIHDINRVTAHRDALYFAGTRQLLALESLPTARIERTGPDSVVIDAPAGLPPGDYDLATSRPAPPGAIVRHRAISVQPLPFGGRQMSQDEFDGLLEQHLRSAQ